jgi:pyrimidine-nucleoside phosphorylase
MSSKPGAAGRERTHRIVDLIRRKRDGGELSAEEIHYIVSRYTEGAVPDYQVAALLMAIVLKQMTRAELAALTEAMLHSGSVLDFSELPAARVDKHSTGGVGDKTSLILAPIVAAAGLYVPMISGRGLGHTGGTLDKLEAIPGFNVNLALADFRRVLAKCGCGLIGQTAEIAPADKKLYSLRDVTGTVESPYLICASIMSKKLAEGIDALVLDVKTGSGAFMKKIEDSIFLAELMVETGKRMGKKMVALITDMDQPLGNAVGNANEIAECIDVLHGRGPDDVRDVSYELAAWMLYLGGRSKSVESGRALAEELVRTGAAVEKFRQIIELQGGDPRVIDDVHHLPQARHSLEVPAPGEGFVSKMMCEHVGTACVVLGGGREKKEDDVDPSVGLVVRKKVGDEVQKGETLFTVHYNSDDRLSEALKLLETSVTITAQPRTEKRPLVHRVLQ